MGPKADATSPLPHADSGSAPRVLKPEKKAGDRSAPLPRPISHDPLYDTDRYRLVTPLVPAPARIVDPESRLTIPPSR
jgi:hypothetical protein